MNILTSIILIPLLLGIIAFIIPWRFPRRILLLAGALLHGAAVIRIIFNRSSAEPGGWITLDPLGLLFLSIVSLLFFLASVYGYGWLSRHDEEGEAEDDSRERILIGCLLIFLSSMSLVTISHHLGLLWVAVEATTLASAPLIYFHRSVSSLEAIWKYLLICSVGIALALMGTFFLAFAATTGDSEAVLTLRNLIDMGPQLNPNLLKAAFIFMLVGYGTKMGLAPLHTWLPDAHSEAPSMASALLSGALLNCAFLAILRMYQICVSAGLSEFAQNLLLVFGLFSMVVAAAFILQQSDYKRMLAYSSVEHMGILAIGIGLGPVGIFFSLLHALFHSLTKGMLFLTAGNILEAYKTKSISGVVGLMKTIPLTGFLWIAGFLAITGTPPFAPFISEFGLLGAAVIQSRYIVGIVYLFLLAVIFVGMGAAVLRMAQGEPSGAAPVRENKFMAAAPLALFVMILFLGVHIPQWLDNLLRQGAVLLGGAR